MNKANVYQRLLCICLYHLSRLSRTLLFQAVTVLSFLTFPYIITDEVGLNRAYIVITIYVTHILVTVARLYKKGPHQRFHLPVHRYVGLLVPFNHLLSIHHKYHRIQILLLSLVENIVGMYTHSYLFI